MSAEARRLALLEASKLKLSAKAHLAEGGKDARFEAAELYHAAARAERRALLATDAPSPEARLASAIEQCACLILGLDPSEVLSDAWPQVLIESDAVEAETASTMRLRINDMWAAFFKKYEAMRRKMPRLDAWENAGYLRGVARSMDSEIAAYLEEFPGDAMFYALRSVSRFEAGDNDGAWEAIQRARTLRPDFPEFDGWRLRIASECRPISEARTQLSLAYASIERGQASPDVCHGFVFAAMDLVPKIKSVKDRRDLLEQILVATQEALGAGLSPLTRTIFSTVRGIAKEMLAGRKPDREILFRFGLGHLAAADPQETNPWRVLRGSSLRTEPHLPA
jgi:hypothetical protein